MLPFLAPSLLVLIQFIFFSFASPCQVVLYNSRMLAGFLLSSFMFIQAFYFFFSRSAFRMYKSHLLQLLLNLLTTMMKCQPRIASIYLFSFISLLSFNQHPLLSSTGVFGDDSLIRGNLEPSQCIDTLK